MEYVDFWQGFDPSQRKQWFLSEIYDTEGVCYSVFGNQYRGEAKSPKVFYSTETDRFMSGREWDSLEDRFHACDFSASFHDRDSRNHLQMPNYVCIYGPSQVKEEVRNRQNRNPVGEEPVCMVASNGNAQERIDLTKAIQQEIRVDCAGAVLNNVERLPRGEKYENFVEFAKNYRFVIAAENTKQSSYTTEKLFNAFRVGAVPIYFGNPNVKEYFNPDAMIHCEDFDSFEDVAKRVKHLDEHSDEYEKIRNTPALPANHMYDEEKYREFIDRI